MYCILLDYTFQLLINQIRQHSKAKKLLFFILHKKHKIINDTILFLPLLVGCILDDYFN